MALSLLLNASAFIQVHFLFALAAVLLGAWQFVMKKGTRQHRLLGRIWVGMMAVICISSFWIKEVMPSSIFFGYSPIHLLSLFVLFQISMGVYFARRGNIEGHQKTMTYTYLGGLIIAGAFTFYPGRLLFRVFLAGIFGT